MSFSNTKLNKEQMLREKRKKDYQANKGNWEYSFFQKSFDPNEESNRKVLLKPANNIDPNNFHLHINPTLPREEIIFNKYKSGEKISKTEKMMLDNWLEKKTKIIEQDIEDIRILGLASKPVTNEGKTILILEVLCHEIKKNNKYAIANIYLRLM